MVGTPHGTPDVVCVGVGVCVCVFGYPPALQGDARGSTSRYGIGSEGFILLQFSCVLVPSFFSEQFVVTYDTRTLQTGVVAHTSVPWLVWTDR